ncbi:MAG TPA: type II toxin-antitoxin system VapC family toxin [Phenylobacterium sp.]|uniref:type II toxin-antitoxin system VapC family toxin n=1 Tax=Phenylobacterium sp. TaxID=1871053 RepID=UPI002CDF8AA9|nr:type II toxin-antitoxin system VapC family toxin [Phenylobacterium sp.]HXA40366.1 type II toxin-antitoxin system VapC family toxin [Phenylobacterium sp.]
MGVLDASVAVKCLVEEAGSDLARAAIAQRSDWTAPDLIFLEVASVALKSLRRGWLARDQAEAMVRNLPELLADVAPARTLADAAFTLAADHGFSAYDAAYLALAEATDSWVLTADIKLALRARSAGLAKLVRTLDGN